METPLVKQLASFHDALVLKGDFSYKLIGDAITEIEKLRATQFRWIPVSERHPDSRIGLGDILVSDATGDCRVVSGLVPIRTIHWAPIPPLPEKSQEEKDEELWIKYRNSSGSCVDPYLPENYRLAFLAGLKAAREEK